MSEDHANLLARAAQAANCGQRFCQIIDASIEAPSGGTDGAYDLLDVSGSPEDVGRVLAECLDKAEIGTATSRSIEDGEFAYLNVRIRVCNPAKGGEPMLSDTAADLPILGERPRDDRSNNLNTRELATVLAALRFWQRAVPERSAKAYSPEHFAVVLPLPHSDIDSLCDRLNVDR